MVSSTYEAALFDLFGTLVDGRGNACAGARRVLDALGTTPWAIVTSCSHPLAAELLRRAELPEPPVLITADDVSRSKPSPEGYLRAARLLEVAPERCIVFEDSGSGLAAARAAGMRAVSVLCGWEHIELAVESGELRVREGKTL